MTEAETVTELSTAAATEAARAKGAANGAPNGPNGAPIGAHGAENDTDVDATMTDNYTYTDPTNNNTANANKPTGTLNNERNTTNEPTGIDEDAEMTDCEANRTTYNTDKTNPTNATSLQRMCLKSLADPSETAGAAPKAATATTTAGPTTATEMTAEPTAANESGNEVRGEVSNPKIGGTPRKIFCVKGDSAGNAQVQTKITWDSVAKKLEPALRQANFDVYETEFDMPALRIVGFLKGKRHDRLRHS
jgi:hypothetical protein